MSARDDRVVAWQRSEMAYIAIRRIVFFSRRRWYLVTPVALLLVFGTIPAVFAAAACTFGFLKLAERHRAAMEAAYELAGGQAAYEAMQTYRTVWPDHARSCGLAQRAPTQALGVRGAAASAVNSVENALHQAAYGSEDTVFPQVLDVERTRLGFCLVIQMLDGQTIDNFRKAADALAACFHVEEVRVSQGRPKVVHVTPVISDPLATSRTLTPDDLVPATDLEWVPLGMNEDGELWKVPLNQTSSVFGGVPGAGKSVAINVLLANVSHRSDIQIIGMDMKGGLELGDWERRCAATAFDQETALSVLNKLYELHKSRMAFLRAQGYASMNNLGYSVEHPLYLVVIDEAAELFFPEASSKEAKNTAAELQAMVSRIVRLCRATGIVVLLATQKPTVDSLPSIIRDNSQAKVAFRCTTWEQAVAILGDPVRSADVTPTSIKKEHKGVAIAADADGVLRRVRAFYISEESRREVVRRTQHLACPLGDPPLSAQLEYDPSDPDDGPDLVLPVRQSPPVCLATDVAT
jgi:hypothetical protein